MKRKRLSDDPRFYLAEVYQYVSQFPVVGQQAIIDRFAELKLEQKEVKDLLTTLTIGGFLYQPRPMLYARFLGEIK